MPVYERFLNFRNPIQQPTILSTAVLLGWHTHTQILRRPNSIAVLFGDYSLYFYIQYFSLCYMHYKLINSHYFILLINRFTIFYKLLSSLLYYKLFNLEVHIYIIVFEKFPLFFFCSQWMTTCLDCTDRRFGADWTEMCSVVGSVRWYGYGRVRVYKDRKYWA